MREIALHLLDVINNSISAGAKNIRLEIVEDYRTDQLNLKITDDGKGIDPETLKRIVDPFYTTRTTRRVGLGIPLLKLAAESCNGSLKIDSEVGVGTVVSVSFQHSHIDRMPLGDIATTMLELVVGTPDVHWTMMYRINDKVFEFDDAEIKAVLEGVPLSDPDVIRFLRQYLKDGIEEIKPDKSEVLLPTLIRE